MTTIYLGLLRGINVGGKNLVSMSRLKAAFERAGMEDVSTFIASGNILFRHEGKPAPLAPLLERVIAKEFKLPIKVLLRDLKQMQATAKAIPRTWRNDDRMKCDVFFLWEEHDRAEVLKELPAKKGVDDYKYVAGAVIWRVLRKNINKTRMTKIVGTKLYAGMTIRNCSTVRKLATLMEAME